MNPTASGATALAPDGSEAWNHDAYDDSAFGAVIGAGQGPVPSDREGARPPRRDQVAELRAAGLVRHASDRADTGVEWVLPVAARLRPLFPGGALRRGTTVAITTTEAPGPEPTSTRASGPASAPAPAPASAPAPARASGPALAPASGSALPGGPGSTSLLFGLLAEPSAAGTWCAAVGLPRLGLVAAAEAGVAVDRLALVPYPGPDWASVVAALLDGVDIVVAATPGGVPAGVAQRLAARARQRGAVLVPVGRWPGADLTLSVSTGAWHGVGQGRGRLRGRELDVVAQGRGAAAHARRLHLWLPELTGVVPVVATPTSLRVAPARPDATPLREAVSVREATSARDVAVLRAAARATVPQGPDTAHDVLPLAG